jgi:hypothetical protein
MLRFEEQYESPKFKGKIFTLAEFKKWYMKSTKKKKFTYYTDWSGFNIPSKYLKPFFDGKFNPLSPKEKKLLSLLKNIRGEFYLIASFKKDKSLQETVDHETTHAIYCFEDKYSAKVAKYFKGKDTQELQTLLVKQGYTDKDHDIMVDEMNAYLTNDMKWLRKKKLNGKHYDKYSKELIELRRPYWKLND